MGVWTDGFGTAPTPWSKQGKSKNCKMMSPLHPDNNGGDEELTTVFKEWARDSMETLSVKGATEKLNDMLGDWTKKSARCSQYHTAAQAVDRFWVDAHCRVCLLCV
jgi:hypothetical protein